jgi:hypothetical protein
MRWRRKHRTNTKHLLSLLAAPLLLLGLGYAVYGQDLSINGKSNKPAYTATPNGSMSYTLTKTPSGGVTIYDFVITVKNISPDQVVGWQVKFDLPADFTQASCATSVTCSTNNQTAIINGGSTTGAISPNGGTVSFTYTFRSANPNYRLQNIYVIVSGDTFKTISGLTVSATRTAGGGLSASNTYRFTVTNSSGATVKMWRIIAGPWQNSYSVVSMDPRVHYGTNSSVITIIDTDPLANSTNFIFDAQMNTAVFWNLSNVAVTGIR